MPAVNGGSSISTEIEQYRALCLLALGRESEAAAAVERLIRANPAYAVSESDTSPRMKTIVESVRLKVVPGLAKAAYAEAKEAFEAKNKDAAQAGFKRTLDLIASLPQDERDALADLKLLASEFMDLAAARPAAPPEPVPAAVKSAPPEPPAPIVPPTPVREALPAWNPPDTVSKYTQYTGVVRVRIDEQGKVSEVSVLTPTHPFYDQAVLAVAKTWLYKPATRGGKPIPSERDIQVRLVPR
jgi:TonB family protein